MKRNVKNFLKAAEVAIGTGLYLLDHSDKAKRVVRSHVNDQVDDLRDRLDDLRERASDTYDVASTRVSNAARALRGDDESSGVWNVVRFAAGVGIGIGIGLLFAPANGEATRAALADKAREIGDNVRQRYSPQTYPKTVGQTYPASGTQSYPATGTGD
jgi:gas vesicle protein